MPYVLAISSIGDAISEFTSVFSTVWTFLMSNWYFTALIIIPVAGLIISMILGFVRSH